MAHSDIDADQLESMDFCDDDDLGASDGRGHKLTGPNNGTTLSYQQTQFARFYVSNGGNRDKARKDAGFKSATSGSKLMLNPNVLAEIKRLSVFNIEAELPKLIARQVKIALDPETKPDLAAKLIFGLMDRAGLRPKTGPLVSVVNNTTTNNDNRQVGVNPQDVLRELDRARERQLSGISASMTDNRALIEQPSQPSAVAPFDQGQGGGVDQGPPAVPSSLPSTSDADTPKIGEKP